MPASPTRWVMDQLHKRDTTADRPTSVHTGATRSTGQHRAMKRIICLGPRRTRTVAGNGLGKAPESSGSRGTGSRQRRRQVWKCAQKETKEREALGTRSPDACRSLTFLLGVKSAWPSPNARKWLSFLARCQKLLGAGDIVCAFEVLDVQKRDG